MVPYASARDDVAPKALAWWIDAEKKTVTEIPSFDCPPIRALAGAGDGGFVALAKDVANPAFCSMLVAFHAAGKPRWKMEANQDFTPESSFAPKGVLVTPRGEVAVFDDIRKTIHLYDRAGKHLHTVDLEMALKRDTDLPSGITADSEGGIIVGDMHEKPPFVSLAADGTVRGEFSPKFKDGGIPDWPGELHVAPDGHRWMNNLHNLVRLDDTAVVDRIVGIQPVTYTLGIIGTAACDAKGQIYAADEQTGAVHVFDADGHKLHVCKPTKTDVPGNFRSTNLTVNDAGRVFLRGRGSDPNFVVFGPDGTRERTVPTGEGFCEWYSRRGSAGMWILNYRDITLTDEKLALGRQIERWPDHSWIESPYSAAVAQDGSLAVLEGNESTASSLGFFSPQGHPLCDAASITERAKEGWLPAAQAMGNCSGSR